MSSLPDRRRTLDASVLNILGEVRSMLRRYIGFQALLTIASVVLFLFWFGGLIDYLPVTLGSSETPAWIRIGLLGSMVLAALWTLLGWALPRWLARIRNRSIALLIERHYPQLNNQLVTAVEVSERLFPRLAKVALPGKAVISRPSG